MPTINLTDDAAYVVSYILNMAATGEIPVSEHAEEICKDVVNQLNTKVY